MQQHFGLSLRESILRLDSSCSAEHSSINCSKCMQYQVVVRAVLWKCMLCVHRVRVLGALVLLKNLHVLVCHIICPDMCVANTIHKQKCRSYCICYNFIHKYIQTDLLFYTITLYWACRHEVRCFMVKKAHFLLLLMFCTYLPKKNFKMSCLQINKNFHPYRQCCAMVSIQWMCCLTNTLQVE